MRTITVTDPAGTTPTAAQKAINPNYRTNVEILDRRGGIFWGFVLLIVGAIWLAGSLNYIDLNPNLALPVLLLIAGVYILMSKLVR
jgi:apolipoprotein N-acyltransferase